MVSIAVLSQKGGVGKTLTATNLGPALTDHGLRVVLVDFDPQADLSAGFGLENATDPGVERRIYNADACLLPATSVSEGVGVGRLAVVHAASEGLRALTSRLLAGDGRELDRLIGAIDADADVVLIDTPAGDTVFGRQALIAADLALVPMLPGYHELRAITRALDLIDDRAREHATHLGLLGVLVTNADPRWRTTKDYTRHLADMAAADELRLFRTVVPRHQPVADHARFGVPTVWLRPRCSVALAYRALAREVLARLEADHGVRLAGTLAASEDDATR